MSSSLDSENDALAPITGSPKIKNDLPAGEIKELLGVTNSTWHEYLWEDFVAQSSELYSSNATGKQWDRGWKRINPRLWEPLAKELSKGLLLRNQTEELAFDTSQWALLKRHESRGREARKKAKKKTRVAAPAGDDAVPELDPGTVGEAEDTAPAESVRHNAVTNLSPGIVPGAEITTQVTNPHYDPARDLFL
ncbi:hypothetical protein LTR17_017526 [Elasticomyces elasticus]|nr:hypothetical protein LTR17_017526 [Elasticomyces elasticus]